MLGARVIAGVAGVLLICGPAYAKPERTTAMLEYGFMGQLDGAGCAPATLSRAAPSGVVAWFEPEAGEDVGEAPGYVVTSATAGAQRVSWSVAPLADECASHADDPGWAWSSEYRDWSVRHRRSVYAIKARARGGVRSIAGFRVSGRTRKSSPTVRRAIRQLGRPSSIGKGRRAGDNGCAVVWRRIGLKILFANFGLGDPCRVGLAQAASVRGAAARRWAALVRGRPGVAAPTERDYLEERFIGEPDPYLRGGWALAEVFSPYGDPGYIPAVSAIFDSRGRVRGFELWIGAAGD